jgi:hypothetical protein
MSRAKPYRVKSCSNIVTGPDPLQDKQDATFCAAYGNTAAEAHQKAVKIADLLNADAGYYDS